MEYRNFIIVLVFSADYVLVGEKKQMSELWPVRIFNCSVAACPVLRNKENKTLDCTMLVLTGILRMFSAWIAHLKYSSLYHFLIRTTLKQNTLLFLKVLVFVCILTAVADAIRTSLGPKGMDKMVKYIFIYWEFLFTSWGLMFVLCCLGLANGSMVMCLPIWNKALSWSPYMCCPLSLFKSLQRC